MSVGVGVWELVTDTLAVTDCVAETVLLVVGDSVGVNEYVPDMVTLLLPVVVSVAVADALAEADKVTVGLSVCVWL